MSIVDIIKNFSEGLQLGMARVEEKMENVSRKVEYKIEKAKKRLMAFLLSLLFLSMGIVLITVGAILFFYRFFSMDAILLVGGAIFLYIALIVSWKR